MNRRVIGLLFIFVPFIPFDPNEAAWMRMNYVKEEYYIPMRDGTRLFTSVLRPRNGTRDNPILLMRTPYSCAPYGEGKYTPEQQPAYWREYCRENYIIVRQDVRGRWMSEGEFADLRPFIKNKKSEQDIDESTDAFDTVDWLVKNIPNNNGHVGILGTSYPGFYAAMAAVGAHPALKAVSPQAPVTDWFMGDDFHHNGAFFLLDAFHFFPAFGKPRPAPTTVPATGYDFPDQGLYSFFLGKGSLKNISKLLGDSIRFWNEIFQHPDYDDWWQDRDARRAMHGIKLPMLIVGGLFDAENCFGAWNLYKAIEKQNPEADIKIVMGPWAHDQWTTKNGNYLGDINFGSNTAAWYQQNIEIPFFNRYLKGQTQDTSSVEATIFFTGENRWRKLEQWPPVSMTQKPLYFQGDKILSWSSPKEDSSFTSYVSDPSQPVPWMHGDPKFEVPEYMVADQRFAAKRDDVLVFQTAPLEEDLVLAGPVIADLKVSTSTTDADFVVKLIDEFPESDKLAGYQMLVRGEIMRGRYRESFSKPVPFTPGRIETVRFELPDVAHRFKKGHRLMVQVQSSWFPLADRNPQQFVNIYEANDTAYKKAEIRFYHDAANPSRVVLPVWVK